MNEESELLRRYVQEKSQSAFADLVRRHLGFVYHTALRCLDGDVHAAEDVAQAVFTDLARKAPRLVRHEVLAGWLHKSARYAALQHLRTEQRRRKYEKEALTMHDIAPDPKTPAEWDRLRPVIDEALENLKPRDRDAILLRFFEGRTFAEMAPSLGLTEDGARLRVNRAVEKLEPLLARRGITSTAMALAAALAAQPAAAAPANLAGTIVAASWEVAAGDPAAPGQWIAMLWGKKVWLAAGVMAVLMVSAGYIWTESPMVSLIVQQIGSDREITLQRLVDGIGDGVQDYSSVSKRLATLTPDRVRMFSDERREVEKNAVVFLDLGVGEVAALNRLYRESRAKMQTIFDQAASVTPGPDSLQIEYRLALRDFQPFIDALDAAIVRELDRSSAAAYARLDKDRLVSFPYIGSPAAVLHQYAMGQVSPQALPEGLVRVKISWSGSGRDTKYEVNAQHGSGGGGNGGMSADAILDTFFGDIVRRYRPQIDSERILH